MQVAVQIDRMSTELVQSDESDAYNVGKSAARFLMLWRGELSPDDLTEHEQRVFLKRTKPVKRSKKYTGPRPDLYPNGEPSRPVRKMAHVFRQNSRFFEYSRVPVGSVSLPDRSEIRPELLEWLVSSDVTSSSKE